MDRYAAPALTMTSRALTKISNNRGNIGNARIEGLEAELGMNSQQFNVSSLPDSRSLLSADAFLADDSELLLHHVLLVRSPGELGKET